MKFPKGFAWGAATASYQNEGAAFEDGKGLSVWDVFTHEPGKIADGNNGDIACDHYHRYREDVALMREIGLNSYRFSLSWPRILPSGTGKVNEKGLDFYDRLVDELLEKGITPYVTIFHWDYPYELFQRGGWLHPDSPEWFAEYTRVVVERLSDRVTHWITQNESQCFIGNGLKDGGHAPGLRLDRKNALLAAHNSLLAHGKSVQQLRASAKQPCQVGFAPAGWWLWCPASDSAADIEACRKQTFRTQEDQLGSSAWWMDPAYLGKYPEDGVRAVEAWMPAIGANDMKTIHQSLDFQTTNVYQAYLGRDDGNGGIKTIKRPAGYAKQAYGWPVVPESLYWGTRYIYERYNLPVYVSENGMAGIDWVSLDGKVHDPQRIDFTARYLQELGRAVEDGVDVRGYFHWTLMDNFEWASGFDQRFGMIYVNHETQERIIKDSGHWYRTVIESNGAVL